MPSEYDPKTLHVISHDFYAGFKQASLDFELSYKPKVTPFDDTQLTAIFTQIASGTRGDFWKAGYHAGLFAALYGIPCCWVQRSGVNVLHYGISGIRRVSCGNKPAWA